MLPRTRRRLMIRAAIWLAVALALAGVFMLYAQPAFLVMLADQLWACF
jgi:hypothetical protein